MSKPGDSPLPQRLDFGGLAMCDSAATLACAANSLQECLIGVSETGVLPNSTTVLLATAVVFWATLFHDYICEGVGTDERAQRAAAALFGLWRSLCATQDHFYGRSESAADFYGARELRTYRWRGKEYASAVDAAICYGQTVLEVAQQTAAPTWQPFARNPAPFPFTEFTTRFADLCRNFTDNEILVDTDGLCAMFALEGSRTPHRLRSDLKNDRLFVPKQTLLRAPYDTNKKIDKVLDKHPEIRRKRPKDKQGKEIPNRLLVNIGDWLAFLEASKGASTGATDPIDTISPDAEAIADIERRKQRAQEQKHRTRNLD